MAFQPVEGSADFPAQEEAVLEFWKAQDIYEKSLDRRQGCPEFVFYEGPPTANGLPHPGHCLTRAVKDLFPRYRTMRGFHCTRKAGWDTHGLPVEVEVCKELGIHSKEEIEAYGVEPFIHQCQESVWRYMREWERLTERLGFWVNLEEAYVTYHQSYVESVWWSLKQLFDRGLLYQGHKIVWWWAQGGTALSAGEVGQGYRQVADPSVYVRFPIVADDRAKQLGLDENTSLLVWTTTPWTLPSNQFVAVAPDTKYSLIIDPTDSTQRLIVAEELSGSIASLVQRRVEKTSSNQASELLVRQHVTHLTEVRSFLGTELVGLRYRPPFDCYYKRIIDVPRELDWEPLTPSAASHRSEMSDVTHVLKGGGDEYIGWRVVEAEFVTTESGTGVVHQAPAFGEVDFDVLVSEQRKFLKSNVPPLLCPVAPNGQFTDEGPEYCRGRWVKDCDKDIIRDLKQRGLLYHQEQYVHDYPFCWRAEEDPLIQYPRESWFVRTTAFKDELLANNNEINWLPEHIKGGRMGKFLESNVDWALSRERYWGTPLPIWKCTDTGQMEAVGSYDELLDKPGLSGLEAWDAGKTAHPGLAEDLKVHKPYIDAISYDSPFAEGARMHRVPDVIDCWYDSGAMPFAQWGYRGQDAGEAAERFREQFPADFISEALDQTRGWFYSQLAISTLLFGPKSGVGGQRSGIRSQESGASGQRSAQKSQIPNPKSQISHPYPHPFRTCIVLGLMLGEDGQKMSKSKRNYREPREIFDRYGADALRWYFFATQPPWTTIRYSEQAIKDSIPEFLLRLWNVYSFFVIYANIDGFDPAAELRGDVDELATRALADAATYRPVAQRSELDRWVVSELHRTTAAVEKAMDAYDNFAACQALSGFVDALSNWYVRRSRERFWMSDKEAAEKLDAYWTLYECLLTTTKLVAPFVPFIAETLWQNLARGVFGDRTAESVHLCDYPEADAQLIDEPLSQRMGLVREIASLGRSARSSARLKVRQPLAKVEVVLADTTHLDWLRGHTRLIEEELNVKAVEFTTEGQEYITYTIVPNFKRLGPRLGKSMPLVKKLLGELDGGELLNRLKADGKIALELPSREKVELDEEDIEVRLEAKEGWSAAQGKQCVVVLATELTDELVQEGLANDVVRIIQDRRKELGCAYTDRIVLGFVSKSEVLIAAIRRFEDVIRQETLAVGVEYGPVAFAEAVDREVEGHPLTLYVKVVT